MRLRAHFYWLSFHANLGRLGLYPFNDEEPFEKLNKNNELRQFRSTLVALLYQRSQELLREYSIHAGNGRWGFELHDIWIF